MYVVNERTASHASTVSHAQWCDKSKAVLAKLTDRLPDTRPAMNLSAASETFQACIDLFDRVDEAMDEDAQVKGADLIWPIFPDALDLPTFSAILVEIHSMWRPLEAQTPRWARAEVAAVRELLLDCARELAQAAIVLVLRAPVLVGEASGRQPARGWLKARRWSPRQVIYAADLAHRGEAGQTALYHEWVYGPEPRYSSNLATVDANVCPECRKPAGRACFPAQPPWRQHTDRILKTITSMVGNGPQD